jgi:1-deoxy-D-xylulose-5-phosphate reductoisomerase
MRLPIALGLSWPNRVAHAVPPLDWTAATSWEFEPLDSEAFPAVDLAKEVGRARRTFPAVFNAANEEAVEAFHAGRIGFLDIVDTVRDVLEAHTAPDILTLESLAEAERWARERAQKTIAARGSR